MWLINLHCASFSPVYIDRDTPLSLQHWVFLFISWKGLRGGLRKIPTDFLPVALPSVDCGRTTPSQLMPMSFFPHRHHGLQEGHEESIRTSSPAHRLRDVSSRTRGPERAPTFRARKVALVMPAVTCTLTSQLAPRSCPLGQLQSAPVSAVLVFLLGQTSKLKAALLHLWSTRSRTAL